MLQNEALAKIESVNLQALEVLQSNAESLNKISEAVKPAETTTAAAVQPEIVKIVIESEDQHISLSPDDLVPAEREDRSSRTAPASPNYSEELMSLNKILEAVKPAETTAAEAVQPEIVIESEDQRISSSSDDLVPTEREDRSSRTTPASPNYSEELVSLGLEQVRVLEFILSEVKNGNSRIASVTDSVQQLTDAVVEGLEQSGTERLAAEEARREMPRDGAAKLGGGQASEKKTGGLGLLGGLALLAKLASEFIAGVLGSLKNAFQTVKTFFSKNLPKVFALAKSIFTSIRTFFSDIGAKISKFFSESKLFTSIKTFFVDLGTKISNFFSESKIFTSIKTFFVDVGTKISNIFTSAKTFFVDLGSKISAFFKESDLIKSITKIFTNVKTFFVNLRTKISDMFMKSKVFEGIRKVFAGAGGIFSKIGGFFGKIGTFISEAWAAIKGKFPMLSKIGSIGSILGKLALPITAILGVFDAVKSGMEEFKISGDIGKSIGEGVKGLVKSVIGAPLDLLKSVVSWIVGKFGFDGVESFLDSFSFSDMLGVFVQRIIDWGRGIFEKFFGTIYDVFTDISSGFDKGPLQGMLEILRGVLKTLLAAPLDMVKNTIASAAGAVGASGVEDYLRSFSFTKMAGGTHTKTLGEQKTSGKSVAEEAGDITAAKRLKEAADEVANEIMEDTEEKKDVLDSIKNPITDFYDALIKAYQENSTGGGPQTSVQAMPSSIGAEISAIQSNTADLESEAETSGPATVVVPQSRTVNNSNQSVTYNSNNIPDRTSWMTTPLASWLGV